MNHELLPAIPSPLHLWRSLRLWVGVAYVLLILRAVPALIVDFWFLDSVGQAGVFWTNFTAQALLFGIGLALFTLAVSVPLRRYATSPGLRSAGLHVGLWTGTLAGWLWSGSYQQYLLALSGGSFGETDPVFGHDIGFYVFTLPAIHTTVQLVTILGLTAAAAAVVAQRDQLRAAGTWTKPGIAYRLKLGLLITDALNLALLLVGLSLVSRTFLGRYELLFKDNGPSGVRTGAEYLDLDGVFSALNAINLSTLVEAGIMITVAWSLYRIQQRSASARAGGGGEDKLGAEGGEGDDRLRVEGGFGLRLPLQVAACLLAVDLVFFLCLIVKDHVLVAPNEPPIQLPYIRQHLAATLRGYRLDGVETVDWRPPASPLSVAALLESKTVQNAPVLPTWVSYLEAPPDVQHYERLEAAADTMVYGPTLQMFEQEQQLRSYYRFLSVDAVRYRVDGAPRMFASAVRELPSLGFAGPRQWLRHWGSAALMYTHGFGLVMSPVNELNDEGGAVYAVGGIPPETSYAELDGSEPRIYFGEGAKDDYILTNIRFLKEFDYATDQFRSEAVYPMDVDSGIRVDSIAKRLVLALDSKDFTAMLFSRFIDHETTRLHLYRTPMQRLRKVAPFLFLDSNVYAFMADGKTLWMINGLTTSANYPYSFREVLGDKADERAVEEFPERIVNYAEDSVKVTIDAYTGEVRLYTIADDPIVDAWGRVYPELFEPRSAMPDAVRAQLTYPLQWFHIQFDDIYKRYHQQHPVEFYNSEDLWDDADETLGSIGRGLTEFGTTDQMTFSYEAYHLLLDPADLPDGTGVGEGGDLQFALLMPFTPEGARNLRSVVLAFQDPGSYGRLVTLRVPQGEFLLGPEQADTLIDTDAQVNQQITLWVRHGSEVVRGHTLLLPVAGDLVYVEPLWIVSVQNPLPQIKLFSVVYRGRTAMSTSLAAAIEMLGVSEADEQRANELPWFREGRSIGQ